MLALATPMLFLLAAFAGHYHDEGNLRNVTTTERVAFRFSPPPRAYRTEACFSRVFTVPSERAIRLRFENHTAFRLPGISIFVFFLGFCDGAAELNFGKTEAVA